MSTTALEVWQPPELRLPTQSSFGAAKRMARNTAIDIASRLGRIYRGESQVKTGRILVLIPAHDEEDTIGATVDAMWQQTRRPDKVVVVADNSKFGRVTPVRINGFESARYLVTELAPDRTLAKAIAARGPELLIA